MDLAERLAFWQRQLRLQDWRVTAEWATSHDIGGAIGKTAFHHTTKEARIRVVREDEWPPESERNGPYDSEQTLVHELLHLQFAEWEGEAEEDGTHKHRAKELAIDLTAWALVRLGRGEAR